MIAWIMGTRLGRFVAWALAGVAFIWAAWIAGRREGRQDAEIKALKAKAKTIERIERADKSAGDVAADRAWHVDRANRGVRSGKSGRNL